MILPVMKSHRLVPKTLAFALTLLCAAILPALAQKKQPQLEKPMAGPRAAPLRVTWLYISPDLGSQKVDRVRIGREMVIAEKSGPWIRVYANTDIQEMAQKDAPVFGHDETPPPISGWMQAKGVVVETTPSGDQVLMGEAANQESLASDPRGPAIAAQSARLLYRRLVEMFPNSPLAPEAAWRAADILWQLQKADASTRPSAKERDAYLRDQMDEDEMKKILKFYPHTARPISRPLSSLTTNSAVTGKARPNAPKKNLRLMRNTRLSFLTDPRPLRLFTRPSIGRQHSLTCLPPMAAIRRAKPPTVTPKSWLQS
jgi:hypothetical protein